MASPALLSKERDGIFMHLYMDICAKRTSRWKFTFPPLNIFRRQKNPTIDLKISDLPLWRGAFPPTCALRQHNPKNSSRNLVEQEPDNAITRASRIFSPKTRGQQHHTCANIYMHTADDVLHRTVCCVLYASRLCLTDFFKSHQKQHTIKTNASAVGGRHS